MVARQCRVLVGTRTGFWLTSNQTAPQDGRCFLRINSDSLAMLEARRRPWLYTGSIVTSVKGHRSIAMRGPPWGQAGRSSTSLTVRTR